MRTLPLFSRSKCGIFCPCNYLNWSAHPRSSISSVSGQRDGVELQSREYTWHKDWTGKIWLINELRFAVSFELFGLQENLGGGLASLTKRKPSENASCPVAADVKYGVDDRYSDSE